MNRRDFLLFRTESTTRIAELSCERLYMRYLDLQLTGSDAADSASESDSERAPVFSRSSPGDVFDKLETDLTDVDVLRIVDPSWLSDEEFRSALDAALSAFRARGGVIHV